VSGIAYYSEGGCGGGIPPKFGAIEVYLTHDEKTGEDHFHVSQKTHHGAGVEKEIASGIVGK